MASAEVAAPLLASAGRVGVGAAVLAAVRATRERVGTNTNLGIALLIAPLAAVPVGVSLSEGVPQVLSRLTMHDAEQVYAAIREAQPGGLGEASEGDVNAPAIDLLTAMGLAADRDRVARQYVTGFEDVLQGIPLLKGIVRSGGGGPELELVHVVRLHLEFMSRWPDSLIARKCGLAMADEARHRADFVLEAGWPETPTGQAAFNAFDAWLRADGHRRNPGTTADLVAATLFAAHRG